MVLLWSYYGLIMVLLWSLNFNINFINKKKIYIKYYSIIVL